MAPGMGNGSAPFYMTPEGPHYAAVAGYYNLPAVSLRNALMTNAVANGGGAATAGVAGADGATPTDAGHA